MEDGIKDVLVQTEKEKEIKFGLGFKWILAVSIGLTGLLSVIGIPYLILGITERIWETHSVNDFLYHALFYTSIILCFVALVDIAVVRKPFSKVLVWCVMAIGILFIISSFIFTHIEGYRCNFQILSFGSFTLIDGTIFIIGLIGVLFSMVMQYGFLYQTGSDMTV